MGKISTDLLDYRIKHKISQDAFAERCDIDRKTVIKAEKGELIKNKTKRKIRLIIGGSDDE